MEYKVDATNTTTSTRYLASRISLNEYPDFIRPNSFARFSQSPLLMPIFFWLQTILPLYQFERLNESTIRKEKCFRLLGISALVVSKQN
jgi:hypothetical protein